MITIKLFPNIQNLSKNQSFRIQPTVKIRGCYQLKRKGRGRLGWKSFYRLIPLRLAPLSLVENEQPLARARFLGSAGYRTTLCPDVRFINLHEWPEPVQPAPTPRKSVIDKVYRMAGRSWTKRVVDVVGRVAVAAIFPRSSGE